MFWTFSIQNTSRQTKTRYLGSSKASYSNSVLERAKTKLGQQRSASCSDMASGGEKNSKATKEWKAQPDQQRSVSSPNMASGGEENPKPTKESKSPNAYDRYKADNTVLEVGPDEVKYVDFGTKSAPCMAATNLHGAFVVIQLSARAGLMAHITPTRDSVEKPSDVRDPDDQEKSILHLRVVLDEMRTQSWAHWAELNRAGAYIVVAYAKFDQTTAAGPRPLEKELEVLLGSLPPKAHVKLVSYLVRNSHGSDSAPNGEVIWLDSTKRDKEGHVTAWPVVLVGEEMIEQKIEQKMERANKEKWYLFELIEKENKRRNEGEGGRGRGTGQIKSEP